MSRPVWILSVWLLLISAEVVAQEYRPYVRSPRAMFMGDAFTSLANDDYTLFYNPAGLTQNGGVELYFLNPQIGATNALDELDRFEDLPEDPTGIVNRFQGFPVYVQAGVTPGFKIGNFGLSFVVNSTTNLVLRNQTYPTIDIDHRYDRGVVMGYAHDLYKSSAGTTSVGVGFKMINRQGLQNSFDVFGTRMLRIIQDGVDDVSAIKDALGYSEGRGYGYDIGFMHTMKLGPSALRLGLSVLDIADTKFKIKTGTEPLPTQEMTINFGSSFSTGWGPFHQTFSFDLHPLNQPMPFGRRMHLGYQLKILMIELMAGVNGGYLNYGVGLDLWPFRLTAGFYSTELGYEYKQEKGSRAIIYLSLLDIDFDL